MLSPETDPAKGRMLPCSSMLLPYESALYTYIPFSRRLWVPGDSKLYTPLQLDKPLKSWIISPIMRLTKHGSPSLTIGGSAVFS